MKLVDQGIVLSKTNYSETSLIIRVLTKKNGLQSFLFQGAKKKKGVIVLPMQPVELTYYKRADSELGKISDWNTLFPISNLTTDPIKSCICFFMAELVLNIVHQDQPNELLTQKLFDELIWLNATNELSSYPVWFLAECIRQSGITPESDETQHPMVLDFKKGMITSFEPEHPFYHKSNGIEWCLHALEMEKNAFLALEISKSERLLAIDAFIAYLSYQISGWRSLKSLEVIQTVIS
jgi:DNA repair protein RecO (recombination protein O)